MPTGSRKLFTQTPRRYHHSVKPARAPRGFASGNVRFATSLLDLLEFEIRIPNRSCFAMRFSGVFVDERRQQFLNSTPAEVQSQSTHIYVGEAAEFEIPASHMISNIAAVNPTGALIFVGCPTFIPSEIFYTTASRTMLCRNWPMLTTN